MNFAFLVNLFRFCVGCLGGFCLFWFYVWPVYVFGVSGLGLFTLCCFGLCGGNLLFLGCVLLYLGVFGLVCVVLCFC